MNARLKMKEIEIRTMKKILSANDRIADQLRNDLRERGILLVNMMSSPGSGKTSLIEETVKRLKKPVAVIEGDIQTTLDAERLAKLGVRAFQINTGPFGGDCHLEASWIRDAAAEMDLEGIGLLFVENIGNLVCPAEFDTGSHLNVLLISVSEGEDKPLKYPLAFSVSHLCLITKIDLVPHLPRFSLERLKENIRRVNPKMGIIELSAVTGQGIDEWIDFLVKNGPE